LGDAIHPTFRTELIRSTLFGGTQFDHLIFSRERNWFENGSLRRNWQITGNQTTSIHHAHIHMNSAYINRSKKLKNNTHTASSNSYAGGLSIGALYSRCKYRTRKRRLRLLDPRWNKEYDDTSEKYIFWAQVLKISKLLTSSTNSSIAKFFSSKFTLQKYFDQIEDYQRNRADPRRKYSQFIIDNTSVRVRKSNYQPPMDAKSSRCAHWDHK